MDDQTAPSGGSQPDDWTRQGRTRGMARGSTLRHGSADTKDLDPELGAQAAVPPGSDEFTALKEQLATVQAEADAAKADTFEQLGDLKAEMRTDTTAAAEQQNVQRLPHPRAGSEYEGGLRAYGADRYAPTDLRAFAARLDLITASVCEDALRNCANMDDLRACIAMMDLDDLCACIAMMGLFISRVSAESTLHEHDVFDLKTKKLRIMFDLKAEMRRATFDLKTEMRRAKYDPKAEMRRAKFKLRASRLPATPAPPPATPTATPSPQQQFLEEQELWLAEDHTAFGAAPRIQNDEDEARENELLCVQAVHSLEAQEQLCAQDKDNAQYLEQENDGLRIQAETKREMDTVAATGSEMRVLCEREMDVAAAEPETGVREMDATASVKIFAVALQDLYNSKLTAVDAPTGSTLNEPESRAFTTNPHPHALSTKNINITGYSRAMVKVGPLARIRIEDEVYT